MLRYIFFILLFGSSFQVLSQQYSFLHKGYKREYIIHLPSSWDGKKPVPLLLCLHGGGGTAKHMQAFVDFDKIADRDAFIVVYPNGWERGWNDGRVDIKSKAHNLNMDDVGFISSLIDTLTSKYIIASDRIFITGTSNGGIMSYKLACALGNKIRGIAPVIACMPENLYNEAKPEYPVKVMIMNGTGDPLVPYNGGYVRVGQQTRGKVVSTKQSAEFWISVNGCNSSLVERTDMPDLDLNDGCKAYKESYASCKSLQQVVVITIVNGGHNMPGKKQYLLKSMIGNTCKDFDGAEEIALFFGL
jgi:polyhydroxybutyrate depolymerase